MTRTAIKMICRVGLLGLCAVSPAVAKEAAPSKPPIEGFWDTPAGRVQITKKGKEIFGVLAAAAEGVKLKSGTKMLLGVLDDDNLSADVRLELVSTNCHESPSHAAVVMLLTRSGKLVGGVSTKEKCAADVSALTYKRAADQAAATATAETAPAGPSPYDAHGKRTTAMQSAAKSMMDEAAQYLNEGQFEKARDLFAKVVEKDPTIGEAYNGMGVTFALRNDWDSAVTWYKKGLEAAPGFGDIYYNLACSYAQLGNNKIALRYLKLATAKGYTEVSNIDADGDLEPLRKDPDFVAFRKQLGNTRTSEQKPAP